MEPNSEKLNSFQVKIKLLEIENQQLLSTLETKNKEIELKSLIGNDFNSNLTQNPDDNIVNLKFSWIKSENASISKGLNIAKKVSGVQKWNCSCFGDKSLIKGKINKWKLQLSRMTGGDGFIFGIIPKGTNINEIDNWKRGYATCSCNFAKHNLGEWTEFLKLQAKEGNIIEIIADLDRGELSFSINGKIQDYFVIILLKILNMYLLLIFTKKRVK